jgi:uncharacterized membrane protein
MLVNSIDTSPNYVGLVICRPEIFRTGSTKEFFTVPFVRQVVTGSSLRTDFTSGLVVLLPLLVCVFAMLWVYNRIAAIPLISLLVTEIPYVGSIIPATTAQVALTIMSTLLLLIAVGSLMRTAVGSVFEHRLDSLMNRVPVVRMVYNASKIAVETVFTDDFDLNRPVKIEAWNGIRLTAFRTGKETEDGRAIVFMPTAPNITSGFVVEVTESDIIETNETVEEALTRVISAGFGEDDSGTAPMGSLGPGTPPVDPDEPDREREPTKVTHLTDVDGNADDQTATGSPTDDHVRDQPEDGNPQGT